MKKLIFVALVPVVICACIPSRVYEFAYDDVAIEQVENCTCFKSEEGQALSQQEILSRKSEDLRNLISHCVCDAEINLKYVTNKDRYINSDSAE